MPTWKIKIHNIQTPIEIRASNIAKCPMTSPPNFPRSVYPFWQRLNFGSSAVTPDGQHLPDALGGWDNASGNFSQVQVRSSRTSNYCTATMIALWWCQAVTVPFSPIHDPCLLWWRSVFGSGHTICYREISNLDGEANLTIDSCVLPPF